MRCAALPPAQGAAAEVQTPLPGDGFRGALTCAVWGCVCLHFYRCTKPTFPKRNCKLMKLYSCFIQSRGTYYRPVHKNMNHIFQINQRMVIYKGHLPCQRVSCRGPVNSSGLLNIRGRWHSGQGCIYFIKRSPSPLLPCWGQEGRGRGGFGAQQQAYLFLHAAPKL